MTTSEALATLRKTLRLSDWALTLHMLQHLAPAFFASEQLAPELACALEVLGAMPAELPASLDQHEAMARVDAVYLRTIRGLPAKPLDAREWVEANATEHPLHAWFIAEVCGVPRPFASRYPFRPSSPLSHLYMLTHEVMLDTGFFSRPLTLPESERILDELEEALPALIADREWDLVAEIAFTLTFAGRRADPAIEMIGGLESPVGATSREGWHAAATALIALAAAPPADDFRVSVKGLKRAEIVPGTTRG